MAPSVSPFLTSYFAASAAAFGSAAGLLSGDGARGFSSIGVVPASGFCVPGVCASAGRGSAAAGPRGGGAGGGGCRGGGGVAAGVGLGGGAGAARASSPPACSATISTSAFSGWPSADKTVSLPSPAACATGNTARHNAAATIAMALDLPTLPPLKILLGLTN